MLRFLSFIIILVSTIHCRQSEFSGSNQVPPDIKTTPSLSPPPPVFACSNSSKLIGGHVVFLVDNSGSQVQSDCPSAAPLPVGSDGGVFYECRGTTNREKAVLSSFDLLASLSSSAGSTPESLSSLSIAQFPTRENLATGYALHTRGWLPVRGSDNRNTIEKALQFTRKPAGSTPYGAAMTSASQLFSALPSDQGNVKKNRLAVIVTDGQPTDFDPYAVTSQANALRQQGINIMIIFVTGGKDRASLYQENYNMLYNFNEKRMTLYGRPWYDTSHYTNFSSYIADLIGSQSGTQRGLLDSVPSKVDASCQDSTSAKCQRLVYEISQSQDLETVIKQVIPSRAVRCE